MRKKILFTWLVFSVLICGKIAAQLPKQSTADNPVWYYIKVIGTASGNTLDRVLTASGDNVVGLPVSYDLYTMNHQLWRFEVVNMGDVRGYEITNKATKKKLSVVFDETKKVRTAVISDNPSTVWRFLTSTMPYYNIWISIEPSGGTTGSIYLFQTGSAQNYELRFGGDSYKTNSNARFSFVLNDNPIASTDKEIVWMNIKNAKTGKYLTDESLGSDALFSMETLISDENDTSQQWKLVYKDNGCVDFINRSTGNVIHTKTKFDRYYYLFNTDDPAESDGWSLEPLGSGQFAISTTNQEGIVNYWYATTTDEATSPYTSGYVSDTPYAWMFSVADEEDFTGVNKPTLEEDGIHVYVYDKRIYVKGHDDYKIVTVYGTPVPSDVSLPTGVYLVTVKGRTTKVLVK